MCFVRDLHSSGSLGLILCSLKRNHARILFPMVRWVGRDKTLDKSYVRHLVYENEVWGGTCFRAFGKPSGPHDRDATCSLSVREYQR